MYQMFALACISASLYLRSSSFSDLGFFFGICVFILALWPSIIMNNHLAGHFYCSCLMDIWRCYLVGVKVVLRVHVILNSSAINKQVNISCAFSFHVLTQWTMLWKSVRPLFNLLNLGIFFTLCYFDMIVFCIDKKIVSGKKIDKCLVLLSYLWCARYQLCNLQVCPDKDSKEWPRQT